MSIPAFGLRVPSMRERLILGNVHPAFSPFGRFAPLRRPATVIADNEAFGMRRALDARLATLWGVTASNAFQMTIADTTRIPALALLDSSDLRPDTSAKTDIFGDYADLGLQLLSRLEVKGERNKNERCTANMMLSPVSNCAGSFQPTFDFQFNVKTGGVVADRVHVNVDYDSEREFDASNNISVYYEGKSDELIERLEVGNVSFAPPSSRFITSGIPSGNYGLQAIGQLGPMRFRTIMAQQKGNVVKDNVFTVGDRTLQAVETQLDDYRIEPRRFFFTIDPKKWLGDAYPNIDILNTQQMSQLAASLADSVRPTRVFVYRLQFNSQPQNPNGPQFLVNDRPDFQRGPIYEYLREGVDYYIDPSQLWIALVRPASLNGERYVIAYTIGGGGINPRTGGNPVVQNEADSIYANLIWDPSITPDDPAFSREIRSVYRVGGEDIQRQTVTAKIVTGAGQEKPVAGTAQSYLQMFGLAQGNNPQSLDVDNRLWPRPSDPNVNQSAGGVNTRLISDYFLVLPSLQPFARQVTGPDGRLIGGLAQSGNPANDTIYRTPGEYLYSAQHPQALYTIRLRYQAEGGGDAGSLALGSVQVRQNSERISIEGRQLKRGTDYTVDYELGRVSFSRPDTLFPQARQVTVQYEENPLFAAAPTTIFGIATQFPLTNGQVNFTAISQTQKTTFNRPPLGFEPASSLVAGVSGAFQFDASLLSRAIERLPFITSTVPSKINFTGELATSRPRPNAAGQAYVESFEGEGGLTIGLGEGNWYLSSQPNEGTTVPPVAGANPFSPTRASGMSWQNVASVRRADGTLDVVTWTIDQIDPLVKTRGQAIGAPEQLLWMVLYPLTVGGQFSNGKSQFQWQLPSLTGHRWRSIRTSLSQSGVDLSRVESLEFWTLIDTTAARRAANPLLVIDLGDVSENTLSISPESLFVRPSTNANFPNVPDSIFTGKQIVKLDTLNTERDEFSRSFDITQNDHGLPGDYSGPLVVFDSTKSSTPNAEDLDSIPLCRSTVGRLEILGDTKANCTIGNSRLDEEDLDGDSQLNFTSPASERLFRYVVDLRKQESISRTGKCYESVAGGGRNSCWILVRVPFRAPTETIGQPILRRVKTMRISMVSGTGIADTAFQTVPIARLKLIGSPWIKRSDLVLRGIGGETPSTGYVIASVIGTTDYDPSRNLYYQSPPGVTDESETQESDFGAGQTQINERSLRLVAGGLDTMQRAEAYFRFPDAQKSFMGYKEMRVWARGRNNGWGPNGELDFFVKIGRDANNFYMYRTTANSGDVRGAWDPEIRIKFQKFFALRAKVQNAYLQNSPRRIDCTGNDSLLIAAIPDPASDSAYAACEDGYMIYTLDPNVNPPNLAAVQELAVGFVRSRVATTATEKPIAPGDSLELWVDDIRLTDVEDTPGYAGQVGLQIIASDLGDIRMNLSRKDPHFRQLAEQPSFVTENAFDMGGSVRLDKLMPEKLGLALPFSVNISSSGSDPLFVARSDVEGAGIQGLRTPKMTATSYSLGLYRQTPLQNKWIGPIVNNLRVNGSYSKADSRSEYSDGTSANTVINMDYLISSTGNGRRIPGWLDRGLNALPEWMAGSEPIRAFRSGSYRLRPASFRISSGIAKSTSNNMSFQKPAASATDAATRSFGLTHVWRNGSTLEFRPAQAFSARWDITSTRDMRHYPDTTTVARVAEGERQRLLGVDLGLERERSMSTSFTFAPVISAWIKPRADASATYTLSRDPNARSVLQTGVNRGAFRLPRRLANQQSVGLGTSLDFARAIVIYTSDSSSIRRIANSLQVVDVSWNRSLVSAFDNAPFTPPLRYQFAIGGAEDFLSVGNRNASSAGHTNSFQVSSGIALPLGLRVSNRYQKTDNQNWTRRPNNTFGTTQAASTNFPDAALQWTYRPPILTNLIASIGGQIATRRNTARTFTPAENSGSGDQRSWSRTSSLPINGSITWGFGGGFSTTGGFSKSEREDELPDNSKRLGTSREMSADVGKPLKLPASWNLAAPLRTHLGYSRSLSSSFISSSSGGVQKRSRLSDNGRHTITVNADTDVAENLTFSLTASRSVNFDRNFDRRFTQTVVTAVLNLAFFAGELK